MHLAKNRVSIEKTNVFFMFNAVLVANDVLEYGAEYDDGLFEKSDNEIDNDFPFISASGFLPIRYRRRSGIVEECCHKPCTRKHLSRYCG